MMIEFFVNGSLKKLTVDSDTPLLWVLRDHLSLTGTKFGCGLAQCGACTVHLDDQAIRSCVTPIVAVKGKHITTIEGLTEGKNGDVAAAIQKAWEDLAVVQCGYCQSGQIMTATTLLASNSKPSEEEIDSAMSGNICRCSTYVRIKKAINEAASIIGQNISTDNATASIDIDCESTV